MTKGKVMDMYMELLNMERLARGTVLERKTIKKMDVIGYAGIKAIATRVGDLIEFIYKKAVATGDQWTVNAVTEEIIKEYHKAESYFNDIQEYKEL